MTTTMVSPATLDLLIAIAYLIIPAQILLSLYKYPRIHTMPFKIVLLLVLFSLFLFLCGAGHGLRFLNKAETVLFHVIHTCTAGVALLTALYLVPLVPHVMDTFDKTLHAQVEQSQAQLTTFMAFLCHEVRNPLFVITSSTQFLQDTTKTIQRKETTTQCHWTDEEKSMIAAIESSAQLLLRLVNDVLDISKIEAGTLELNVQEFDLQALCKSLECNTRAQMAQKHKTVQLAFDVDANVPQFVRGDPIRMLQILYNLLSNAAKFTQQGHVRFHASLCSPEETAQAGIVPLSSCHQTKSLDPTTAATRTCSLGDDDHDDFAMSLLLEDGMTVENHLHDEERIILKVTVTDSGVGIPTDRLSTLFEPYTQAKLSAYRSHGGTGLGLAIAASVLNVMGGSIAVTSTVNKGTSFTVLLPLLQSYSQHKNATTTDESVGSTDGSQSTCESEYFSSDSSSKDALIHEQDVLTSSVENVLHGHSPTTQLQSSSSPRVLVTDDNSINRKIMGKMLSYYHIDYDLCVNGQEAIDKYKSSRNHTHQPDAPLYVLVFMDLHMPVCDGYEAIATLRQLDATLPIVALTANALSEERTRALALGANEFHTKPLLRENLYDCCQRLSLVEGISPLTQVASV